MRGSHRGDGPTRSVLDHAVERISRRRSGRASELDGVGDPTQSTPLTEGPRGTASKGDGRWSATKARTAAASPPKELPASEKPRSLVGSSSAPTRSERRRAPRVRAAAAHAVAQQRRSCRCGVRDHLRWYLTAGGWSRSRQSVVLALSAAGVSLPRGDAHSEATYAPRVRVTPDDALPISAADTSLPPKHPQPPRRPKLRRKTTRRHPTAAASRSEVLCGACW